MPRIASDMCHEDIDILYAETVELGQTVPHIARIHVAIDRPCGFELAELLEQFETAYVSGVPDLVHVFEMLKDAGVKIAVGVR